MFERVNLKDFERYDRAVDSAIATCGGDLRSALKALIIANEFLEEELRQCQCAIAEETSAIPKRYVA